MNSYLTRRVHSQEKACPSTHTSPGNAVMTQLMSCLDGHLPRNGAIFCVTISGLDIRLVDAVARGASRFENLLAPPKTYWPPKKLTGPFPKTKLVR